MKIYTFYTDSHTTLLNDYFLPSLQPEDNFEVVIEKFPQECKNGNFMASGWIETMQKKVSYILRGIEENWGSIFIHADCDICFFKPFKDLIMQEIQDYDIVGQHDGGGSMCCGFFACRGNDNTKKLFEHVLRDMHNSNNDQQAFNTLKDKYVKSKVLDDRFFNVNSVLNGRVWTPALDFDIGKDIVMLHANWTVGVDNKCKLMNLVKSKIL